ncbi:MFS transporter [Martelella mediterranea]|uniref:Putative MFS family arabinose efflux permease n=1 Tax=Martelella mediterranea TaxID=293089 RepID=A0A4R3NU64_9HYPH|nr:MFS transporter [Martelella mediterranea]TCT40959.1 putative MFS family arabinose efflux permease [Martelella mediterranea]
MFASLIPVTSLMVSTLLMMIGYGLMNYLLPVRAVAEDWSPFLISMTATGYTVGFTLSCIITPKLVLRVGHVRVFGALITLLTVSILISSLVVVWQAWIIFRAVSGFAVAGCYLVIESWLNERVTNETRGTAFALYMVVSLGGSIGGQYLVPLGDPLNTSLFIVCGMVFAIAILPTALSTAQSPAPIAQAQFGVGRLYRRSPAAFAGAILAGVLAGAWGSLGGVYTTESGFTTAQGATLLAFVLAGGALGQVPIGRISDRTDRRYVMIACGIIGMLASTFMFFLSAETLYLLYGTAFLVGSMLYPIYALNVAHANDRADPSEFVTISSSLMILYGLGTIAGPLVGGAAMEIGGPRGLMLYLALGFFGYGAFAAWRVWHGNPMVTPEERSDFQAVAVPMRGTDPAGSFAVDYEEEYEPNVYAETEDEPEKQA